MSPLVGSPSFIFPVVFIHLNSLWLCKWAAHASCLCFVLLLLLCFECVCVIVPVSSSVTHDLVSCPHYSFLRFAPSLLGFSKHTKTCSYFYQSISSKVETGSKFTPSLGAMQKTQHLWVQFEFEFYNTIDAGPNYQSSTKTNALCISSILFSLILMSSAGIGVQTPSIKVYYYYYYHVFQFGKKVLNPLLSPIT